MYHEINGCFKVEWNRFSGFWLSSSVKQDGNTLKLSEASISKGFLLCGFNQSLDSLKSLTCLKQVTLPSPATYAQNGIPPLPTVRHWDPTIRLVTGKWSSRLGFLPRMFGIWNIRKMQTGRQDDSTRNTSVIQLLILLSIPTLTPRLIPSRSLFSPLVPLWNLSTDILHILLSVYICAFQTESKAFSPFQSQFSPVGGTITPAENARPKTATITQAHIWWSIHSQKFLKQRFNHSVETVTSESSSKYKA